MNNQLKKLLPNINKNRLPIVLELMKIVEKISGLTPLFRDHYIMYKLSTNRGFVYINHQSKKMYIGYFKAKHMIDEYPLIAGAFDQIMKYNAKQYLNSVDDISEKYVKDLVNYAWKFHNK